MRASGRPSRYSLDRTGMVTALLSGNGNVGND